MTNYKRTCSVYAINNTVCGIIKREDLLDLTKNNVELKNRIMQKMMTSYKDNFFKLLITMIRNVSVFRVIPNHVVQKIMLKLAEKRFYKDTFILKMGEVSDTCYFVLRGRVGVYAFTGDFYDYEQTDSIDNY